MVVGVWMMVGVGMMTGFGRWQRTGSPQSPFESQPKRWMLSHGGGHPRSLEDGQTITSNGNKKSQGNKVKAIGQGNKTKLKVNSNQKAIHRKWTREKRDK